MKSTWTKETALAELHALAEEAHRLATDNTITVDSPTCPQCDGCGRVPVIGGGRECPACHGKGRVPGNKAFAAEHTRWTARTLATLEQVFGRNSRYFQSFDALAWRETGPFILPGGQGTWRDPQAAIDRRHQGAYIRDLETARGVLLAASDELARTDLAAVYDGKDTAPETSAIIQVINIVPKLRKVIRSTPQNEREVQDSFEDLLIGADLRYSREADRIEYSSKTYVPDFTMSELDLAIDLKLCTTPHREKEMIAEINDDILAYRTKYGNILFVVYDVGQIRDVDRFAASFERHENVIVKVVKQ